MTNASRSKCVRAIRWSARIVGSLVALLMLAIAIGEGIDLGKLRSIELVLMIATLIPWLGLILAWRFETVGGGLVLGGMIAFYAIHFVSSGRMPGGWVFPTIAFLGVLFLICRLLDRSSEPRQA